MNQVLDSKTLPKSDGTFLEKVKNDILQSQLRAASSITLELTQLYWRIGKDLSEKTTIEGWGTKTF
ncbi:MAG: hypothetical protein ChlgKO_02150 [Chlamydiales bacterium]